MNPTEKEERGKAMEEKLLESFSSEYSTIAFCRCNLASVRFIQTEQQLGRLPPGSRPTARDPIAASVRFHRKGRRSIESCFRWSKSNGEPPGVCLSGLSPMVRVAAQLSSRWDEPNGKRGKGQRHGRKVARIILFRVFNHRYLCRRNLASVRFIRTEQQLGRLPPGSRPTARDPIAASVRFHRTGRRSIESCFRWSKSNGEPPDVCLSGVKSDGACSRSVVFPLG